MAIDWDKAEGDSRRIFKAALDRVNPRAIIDSCMKLEGDELVIRTELEEARLRLDAFDRIIVAGMGKAAAPMARGTEEVLGDRITRGLVAVKEGHLDELARIEVLEAGHPLPDARSERAAMQLLRLGEGLDDRTLVIVLISGGGSAIACAPAEGLSLADKSATTGALLSCGAPIQEINCLRKHLSSIKGGRLAIAYWPATVVTLVLSDVIGDDLDVIASGPTVPDHTTFADALRIVGKYDLEGRIPARVMSFLHRGATGGLPETPKPGDKVFTRTRTILLGTNRLALIAAADEAKRLGYSTLVLSSRLTGEAREVAHFMIAIGKDIAVSGFPLARPACVVTGGETTVTLRGGGKGGRNQEMALAFLAALQESSKDGNDLFFLAASTDGTDGPTDAAGAFASSALLRKARAAALDPAGYLAENDSYHFFDACGGLIRTGPTRTNVCDIQLLLVP
jgi:glycerate 2-kinase